MMSTKLNYSYLFQSKIIPFFYIENIVHLLSRFVYFLNRSFSRSNPITTKHEHSRVKFLSIRV